MNEGPAFARDDYGQDVEVKVPMQSAWGFLREDVFPDGASFPHPIRELTRAAWAAVSASASAMSSGVRMPYIYIYMYSSELLTREGVELADMFRDISQGSNCLHESACSVSVRCGPPALSGFASLEARLSSSCL